MTETTAAGPPSPPPPDNAPHLLVVDDDHRIRDLVASFLRIQRVDPQFRAEGILMAGLQPPQGRYPDRSEALARFYEQLLERSRALPGVTGAAVADSPPLTGGGQSPLQSSATDSADRKAEGRAAPHRPC